MLSIATGSILPCTPDAMQIQVIWDPEDDPAGNSAHVLDGGVTLREVDEVLSDPDSWVAVARSASNGFPLIFGKTRAGRRLAVVFEIVEEDPPVVVPSTAYEPARP